MEKTAASPTRRSGSLLPYLQGGAGARLSLLPADSPAPQRSYPFQLLDDSAPYSRVVEASFLTDAGRELKKVILHVEKDVYAQGADPFRHVTNPDLSRGWEDARAALRAQGREDGVLIFSQTDGEKLVRLSSLFYCRERELFFHPVCPSCGLPLSLCTDDEFLAKAGLSPYSTSAKRYLFCRGCCGLGLQEIYLYEREHGDPLSVKDRWALIERFGAVDGAMDPGENFPCVHCTGREACFGEKHLARTRITPFSFYPFHLLITDAPTIHCQEFLSVAAGAPAAELERSLDPLTAEGRIKRLKEFQPEEVATLFPADDPRFFLELLFLKLSLLSEVMQQCLPLKGAAAISMERIWIKVTPLSRDLPTFWNFSVRHIEAIAPGGEKRLGCDQLTQLGLIWLQALVSGREVGRDDLLHAVADHMALGQGALADFLVPQNIYWHSGREVPGEWLPFWERACSLGLQLVTGACGPSPGILLQQLAALLAEIKSVMFAAPRPEATVQEEFAGDALLREVVAKLVERYRAPAQEPKAGATDESEMATVIIAPSPPTAADADDPVMETVMLPAASSPPAAALPADDAAMTETVLLSPASSRSAGVLPADDAAMIETVLLSPAYAQATQGKSGVEDAMAETVVIRPRTDRNEVAASGERNCSAASLLETMAAIPGAAAPSSSACSEGHAPIQQAGETSSPSELLETVMIAPRQLRPQGGRGTDKKGDGSGG